MKRTITVILSLCVLFCLAACGGKKEETVTPPAPEETTETTETVENNETQEADLESGIGVYDGNIYTNELLDLRCELPSDWSFYSKEEIAKVNNMTVEQLEGSDIAKTVAETGQYTDLYAIGPSSGGGINLIISTQQLMGFTDRQIFEAIETIYREQFASANMEISTYEIVTRTFCGEERDCLHVVLETDGYAVEEYQIYVRSDSEYWGTLTLSAVQGFGEDPASYMDFFSKLK